MLKEELGQCPAILTSHVVNNPNILLNGRSIACGGRQDHQTKEALVLEQTPTGTGTPTGQVTFSSYPKGEETGV